MLKVLPELCLCLTRFTKPLKGKFQLLRSPGRSLSHPGGSVLLPGLLLVDFPEPGLDKHPVIIIPCHSQQLAGNHLDLIPQQILPGPQQHKALPLPWQRTGGPKISRGKVNCPILLPCFQWDPGCCCGQRGQRALGAFLVHLEMLTELRQGIRAEVSVSYRVLQPQPEPSGTSSSSSSWNPGRAGFAALPKVRAAPCRTRAPSRAPESSLRGQKAALGSLVWGNHHPC